MGQDAHSGGQVVPRPPRGWIERALEWIEPENNPSRVVYGLLVTGAVLAAESAVDETMLQAVGSVAVTVVLLWVAHAYSYMLGERMASGGRWSPGTVVHAGVHEWPLIRGSIVPLVVLIISGLAGASTSAALLAALITAIALLVLFELIAGWRTRLPPAALVVQAAVGAVLGIGIIALKVIVHK